MSYCQSYPTPAILTDIFRQGSQGVLDGASKGQLESEFGTSREEEVVKAILERGTVIESESSARQGETNQVNGGGH